MSMKSKAPDTLAYLLMFPDGVTIDQIAAYFGIDIPGARARVRELRRYLRMDPSAPNLCVPVPTAENGWRFVATNGLLRIALGQLADLLAVRGYVVRKIGELRVSLTTEIAAHGAASPLATKLLGDLGTVTAMSKTVHSDITETKKLITSLGGSV